MRTLFLLIVIIQACCAIRVEPRQSVGSGDDDCEFIERVVMTEEASAQGVQLIYSKMIPERNQLEQITLINCQQLIIGRIR